MGSSVASRSAADCRVPDNEDMPTHALTVHDVLALHCPGLPWTPARRRALDERVRVRRLAAGATLFAQGDVAAAMYGVLAGEVDLRFSTADGHGSVVERAPP